MSSIITYLENPRNAHTECKRKLVKASFIWFSEPEFICERAYAVNGPVQGSVCSNEIGNCGCMHAEIRLLLHNPHIHGLMACQYSPCTQCANAIVDSRRVTGVVYLIPTQHDLRGLDRLGKLAIHAPTLDRRVIRANLVPGS